MKGTRIIVSANPRGAETEGTIVGSGIYPGTALQVQLGVSADGTGRMSWVPYQPGADGDPMVCAILLEDDFQGFLWNVAYVTGTRGRIYFPLPGEEMNICVAAQAGTGSANAYTVGERMMPHNGTGQHISQGTATALATFVSMEHLDVTADVVGWLWAMRQ